MISFTCDYTTGAHPKLLERLMETNFETQPGYGADDYSRSAKEKIRAACGCPEADIWFLVGGTQTNQAVIASVLERYEGVFAAETGHVSQHEAGAIEYSGHKVLTLPQHDGKISAADVQRYLDRFYGDPSHSHMVFPGMVYISHPTEYGTLYTKAELEELSDVCRKNNLPLYLDGARLGYGLMSRQTDVTLPDIARLCDVFYIGGTKVGALCGEAVVFTKNNTPKHFLTVIKQHGALLAKGRLTGLQFDALFTEDLYFELGRHAIAMAEQLKAAFREKGYCFYLESPTNQQFVILDRSQRERLAEHVCFEFWEALDEEHAVVRFATSWSTKQEEIEALRELL